MKKSTITWITIGVIALLLIVYVISGYNRFVSLNQDINGKWSEVENQYQRQADLIPNLVSVISSAVKVETNYVKDITEARTNWLNAKSDLEKDAAGVQMNNGVTALVSAVSENYPQLKANTQYVALTDELSGTQNRVATARGRYISSIQAYNTAVMRFPSNILASIFGFGTKEYYKAENDSLNNPTLGTGTLP
ncbi:MAG TPA: LemA family protein [Candidatus Nanoarchaeia archaeon]|nr:LemA family protein [Candidatus Nanoarchaeia archaeon]